MVHLYFVIEGEVEFMSGNESFATVGESDIFGLEDFIYRMNPAKRIELLDREGFFSDQKVNAWPLRAFTVRVKSDKIKVFRLNMHKCMYEMQ